MRAFLVALVLVLLTPTRVASSSKPAVELTVTPTYSFEPFRRAMVQIDLSQQPEAVGWCVTWVWFGTPEFNPDTKNPKAWEKVWSPIAAKSCGEVGDAGVIFLEWGMNEKGVGSPLLPGDYKAQALVIRKDGSIRVTREVSFRVIP
jgi:hypothetical protein